MLSFTVSKRYFYVDTECFKNLDFIDAFLLNEDDFIVLFGNENDNKLSIRDLKKLFKCRSNLGFKEIQIDTKTAISLAVLLNAESDNLLFIVSDNPSFEIVRDYINKITSKEKVYLINTSNIQNFNSKKLEF